MENTTTVTVPVTGNWKEQKDKLKAKFSVLTDADLNYAETQKDEMLGKIQAKVGKTKEEFATIIAAL